MHRDCRKNEQSERVDQNVREDGSCFTPPVDARSIRRRLRDKGFEVSRTTQLVNDQGTKFDLECGAVVTVYKTRRYQIQGKARPEVKRAIDVLLWDYLSPPLSRAVRKRELVSTSPAEIRAAGEPRPPWE